jgi:hypothetical protein
MFSCFLTKCLLPKEKKKKKKKTQHQPLICLDPTKARFDKHVVPCGVKDCFSTSPCYKQNNNPSLHAFYYPGNNPKLR